MDIKKVLIICNGNSVRGQIAEGFFKKYGFDYFDVISAGINPLPIHPLTRAVMEEVDVSIEEQESLDIKEFLGWEYFDFVIFLSGKAEQEKPRIFPDFSKKYSWIFENPANYNGPEERKIEKFRALRRGIEGRVKAFIEEYEKGFVGQEVL